MIFAASPPLTRRAITTTTAAIHSRAVGGEANITTPRTTSAARTPVNRTGLLPGGAVLGAKVSRYKDHEGVKELRPIEMHFTCRAFLQ
jgi:hypothetical protein